MGATTFSYGVRSPPATEPETPEALSMLDAPTVLHMIASSGALAVALAAAMTGGFAAREPVARRAAFVELTGPAEQQKNTDAEGRARAVSSAPRHHRVLGHVWHVLALVGAVTTWTLPGPPSPFVALATVLGVALLLLGVLVGITGRPLAHAIASTAAFLALSAAYLGGLGEEASRTAVVFQAFPAEALVAVVLAGTVLAAALTERWTAARDARRPRGTGTDEALAE